MNSTQVFTFMKNPIVILFLISVLLILIVLLFSTRKTDTLYLEEEKKFNNIALFKKYFKK